MAAGGAVSWCLRAQVQKHGSCQFQVGTEGKIVRGELSRGCLAGCCSRDSMCGLVVLSWQVGNDYGRRLSGSRSKVLSGDLSSHSVSSGRSLSILQDKVRRTRECRGIMWLSGKSSKSMLRKSFEPQSKRTPIPWTSWRMEQLVRGFSKKEEERRRIVHSVNFLGKRRSAFEPKNLINCSRLSTDHRCRVSLIIPKEQSPQSLLQHAQQESSAPWSRKTVAKLQSFSPQVSQEHQILGASTEDFSPVRLTTSKTAGHIVRSRAWTAWKQVLSSTSFNFRDNEVPSTPHKGVIPAEQNSCTFTWHCGPPVPAEFKLGDLRESSSEDIRSSKMRASRGTMKQDKDGLKLAKDAENQEVVVDRSESKLSPRELAVGALIQALSPRLDPKKYGQGELALRMADFVCALKASVQTNEIKHCERHAQAAIAAMIDGAHLAQLDVDIFQLWLDVTEIQLMTAPREADVVQLQNFLEGLQDQSQKPQTLGSLSSNTHQDRMLWDSQGLGDLDGVDKDRRLESVMQAALHLEQILADIPSPSEISAKLISHKVHSDAVLQKQEATTTAALKQYRQALGRGEVAWLRNLDDISSRLETVAKAVLPMETAFEATNCGA